MAQHWIKGIYNHKVKCNECGDIIEPTNTEWTECTCGDTKIKATGTYKQVEGKNWKDLSTFNMNQVPEHRGFDDSKK